MSISSFIKGLVEDEFNRRNVPANGYASDGVFSIIDDYFYDTDTAKKLATVQSLFENVLMRWLGRDSSWGCGPERAVAGWLDLRSD